jgi:hypothetical protein
MGRKVRGRVRGKLVGRLSGTRAGAVPDPSELHPDEPRLGPVETAVLPHSLPGGTERALGVPAGGTCAAAGDAPGRPATTSQDHTTGREQM